MSDPVLRAKLVEAARLLYRTGTDLESVAASLTDVVRLDPIEPRWVVALPFYWCMDRDRLQATRRIFRHYQRLRDELGVRVTGVGSEGKLSRGLWGDFFDPIDYREYPQTFQANHSGSEGLRAKFDETIRATRHLDPSRVFIGGSDDLIPLDWYAKAFASDADMVGVTGGAVIVGFQRFTPNRTYVWNGVYPGSPDVEFCGGGLVLSRKLLEAWDWAPFDAPGDEVRLERRARSEGWACEGFDGRFYAVKCGRSLNPVQVAQRLGAVDGGAETMAEFRRVWDQLG